MSHYVSKLKFGLPSFSIGLPFQFFWKRNVILITLLITSGEELHNNPPRDGIILNERTSEIFEAAEKQSKKIEEAHRIRRHQKRLHGKWHQFPWFSKIFKIDEQEVGQPFRIWRIKNKQKTPTWFWTSSSHNNPFNNTQFYL